MIKFKRKKSLEEEIGSEITLIEVEQSAKDILKCIYSQVD